MIFRRIIYFKKNILEKMFESSFDQNDDIFENDNKSFKDMKKKIWEKR